MRVSRASEERRQEILDAAMQVFYLKGYEKATIRDIALDIGVAQGLIYRYFKSKEALFAARWIIMQSGWRGNGAGNQK